MKNRSTYTVRMKAIGIQCLLLLVVNFMYGQTFSVQFANGYKKVELPGYPVQIQGVLKNLSSGPLLLDAVRVENDLALDWQSMFCLDQCYAPSTDSVQIVVPRDSTVIFYVDFETSTTPDSSHVKMKIKNVNNPSETSLFDFYGVTSATAGITGINSGAMQISVSPNPFTHSTFVSLGSSQKDQAVFLLYDVLGNQVRKLSDFSQNHFILEREDLPAGIYIYRVLNGENEVGVGKIIAH